MGNEGGGFHPRQVWSPAGGWFPDPYHWRRNTAIALGAIGLACVPVFLASAKKEVSYNGGTWPVSRLYQPAENFRRSSD